MANPGDGSESDNDFKVVLAVRGGIAMVGVHQPARDAHIESFAYSSLEEMLPEVQGVVERASETWEVRPRHPDYVKPEPKSSQRLQQSEQKRPEAEDDPNQAKLF